MELTDKLTAIGFTEYEARVYLALLRVSPATGYQLSKEAGVPRSMVYEALGRLHVRGAVLRTDENRATLYRPLPPDLLLDKYEEEHTLLLDSLRDGLESLYTRREEDRFWSITGRSSVVAYANQMIQTAKDEILLVLTDPDLEDLRAAIEAACGRGVRASALLLGQGDLACGQVSHHSPQESELQDLTSILVVVADNQESLIASGELESSGTITRNRNLVLISRQFIWMELFAQRVSMRLNADQLKELEPEDRRYFASFSPRL
jgi:Cd2+/Zn2+-exporting ATPase